MIDRLIALKFAIGLSLSICGCSRDAPPSTSPGYSSDYGDDGYGGYGGYGYGDAQIKFLDEAPANTEVAADVGLSELNFTSVDGVVSPVRERLGPRGAVLVVTRGATDPICPYCSTQTAAYIRDYEQFQSRGIEVLLVYPLETSEQKLRLDPFLANVRERLHDAKRKVPFPVLFDVELSAVNHLGIRKDLSKPSTYIIDKDGVVRYAYVGAHLADRPATTAVLAELDRLLPTDPDPPEASSPPPIETDSTEPPSPP